MGSSQFSHPICKVSSISPTDGGVWMQTGIHTLTGGDDGSGPGSGVAIGRYGSVYGGTPTGGANGQGVIYKLRPMPDGTWKLTVIHAFTGGDDGAGGSAGRLLLYKGGLYSVTRTGGAKWEGVAYKITKVNGVWQ